MEIKEIVEIFIWLALVWIWYLQYKINKHLWNINDVVELYSTVLVQNMWKDKEWKDIIVPFIHIQNVWTRLVYFDNYTFNWKIYKLNWVVRPSVYSQAEANFYWIELPTNWEKDISLEIEYHDVDQRKWKSLIIWKEENWNWKINTFPKKRDK